MKPKKKQKKPVKKSGAKAASVAGHWMSQYEQDRKWTVSHAVLQAAMGNKKWLVGLINDIDILAASVLSQKEK